MATKKAGKKAPKTVRKPSSAARPATAPRRRELLARTAEVRFTLDVKAEGLEPILGAAYLLTDRAYALVEGDRAKRLSVSLRPKEKSAALAELADSFEAELDTQKVRWAIAKNNIPVREYVAEQAVALANGAASEEAAPAAEELTDQQRLEIEKLIAEVEEEVKALNQKKTASDPKNIAAAWEEKQQAKTTGGGA